MNHRTVRVALAACAAALSLTMMAGCMGGQQTMSEEAQAQANNRNYMSQVNQVMLTVEDCLEDFSSAVAADDLAAMRSAATQASRALASLETIEAPEALADLQAHYVSGCNQLQSSLDQYMELFTEVENAGGSIDGAAYSARLSEIQQSYDAGIQELSAADETAAGME